MQEKTAGYMDFLAPPSKVASAVYEVLAKEASDAFLKEQVAPAVTIAKQASARGFNNDQIHRVVELANHQINAMMAKDAEDQTFTFPTATPELVLAEIAKANTPVEKSAEAPVDFGVYDKLHLIPDYVDVIGRDRMNQKIAAMPKEAAAPEPEIAVTESTRKGLEQAVKYASGEVDYARSVVQEHIGHVRFHWDKLASDEDKNEFLAAAAVVLNPAAAEQLSMVFGVEDWKADLGELSKIAEYLDSEAEIVKTFAGLKPKLEAFDVAQQKLAGVQEKLAGVIDALKSFGGAVKRFGKHVFVAPARVFKAEAKIPETIKNIREHGLRSVGAKSAIAVGAGLGLAHATGGSKTESVKQVGKMVLVNPNASMAHAGVKRSLLEASGGNTGRHGQVYEQ